MRRAATSVGCSCRCRAQERFGLGNAVLAQRGAGGEQARVARGRLEETRARGLGAGVIADRPQVIGKRAPRIRQIRVQLHGAPQLGHRLVPTPECSERHAMLIAGGRPARLCGHQRRQERLGCSRIAPEALRDRQHQQRIGMPRRGPEDLARLLGGEGRVTVEQPRRMGEGDLERPDRFRCDTAAHVTNLPRSLRLQSRPGGNCTHATAAEQCGVTIQFADRCVALSQRSGRVIRGGAWPVGSARRRRRAPVSMRCAGGRGAPGSHSGRAVRSVAVVSPARALCAAAALRPTHAPAAFAWCPKGSCRPPGSACTASRIASVLRPTGVRSWRPCPVHASCRSRQRGIPTATSTAGGHPSVPPTAHSALRRCRAALCNEMATCRHVL